MVADNTHCAPVALTPLTTGQGGGGGGGGTHLTVSLDVELFDEDR